MKIKTAGDILTIIARDGGVAAPFSFSCAQDSRKKKH